MPALSIRTESAASRAARRLIDALDAELTLRYPGEPTNGIDAEDFEATGGVFLIGYLGTEAVACGAFRPTDGAAEVKRMFVAPAYRGRGFARDILRGLEAEAAVRGFPRAILETGIRQPEAISLYRAEGWRPIPCFGQFAGDPMSLCFEKELDLSDRR